MVIKVFLFVISLTGCIVLSSFNNQLQKIEYNNQHKIPIQKNYLSNFGELIKTLENLKEAIQDNPSTTKKVYLSFRRQFKQIEHWIAYLDEGYYVKHINGAPLPKLDPNVPRIEWFEPKGLQHLDELIYDDMAQNELAIKQIDYLNIHLKAIYKRHTNLFFQTRYIYESFRRQLIRLYTLGVTGFDTPGSVQAIEDATASLEGMLEDARLQPELFPAVLLKDFEKAIAFCRSFEFDDFDRLGFLTQHLDPLSNQILHIQQSNNIELPQRLGTLPSPTSYTAESIFDNSFLNKEYYGLDYKRLKINKKAAEDLGKTLFYEPALSSNNQMACVTCHQPEKGFSDGLPRSKALGNEGVVERNSPTIINSIFADRFFHDLRAHKLIDQPTHVIQSHAEFNTSYPEIIDKLSKSEEYKALFKAAFPGLKTTISEYSISHSLSAFVQSVSGFNSPFDLYVRGESNELSADVKQGYNLFMGKAACATCHFPPTFSGLVPPLYTESESEILGVPADPKAEILTLDSDLGRYKNGLTKERADIYQHAFKTPTVRNITLTAPYMHNGSYHELEDVVEFYNVGGGQGLGLTVPNQTLPPDSLHLEDGEIKAIIAFMTSLTDTTGMTSKPTKLPFIPGVTRGSGY